MTDWPWPAPQDDGGAAHLSAGTSLPAIELASTAGGVLSLDRLYRKSIVAIYPWTGRSGQPNPPDWDDIPGAHGSTAELIGLRDHYLMFQLLGIDIVAVSAQASAEQVEFATRTLIPFPMLSDAGGVLRDRLRLPHFTTGGTSYLRRLTLVAERGVISQVIYPVHPPDRHAADMLARLVQTP
jgi:peroxiredoxin